MNFENDRNVWIEKLSQYKQRLDDVLLEEACRQWYDFTEESTGREDGEGFAAFYREIYSQKYYDYIKSNAFDYEIDPIGNITVCIRLLADIEEKIEGQRGQFAEWVHISYDLREAFEMSAINVAHELRDTFNTINDKYGSIIARRIYNSECAVLPNEILNAAEYICLGGKLEHIRKLCEVGFFMPAEYEQFGPDEKAKAIEFVNGGGMIDDVYEAIQVSGKSEKAADVDTIEGVTEVHISAQEFEIKMKELLPDASEKAIRMLINYAEELHDDGVHPKGAFFSESYVNYSLAVRQHGNELTSKVLKICEESCFNPWEIRDAARLITEGVPPDEIMQKSIDGKLDLLPKQRDELEAGLAALRNGTLEVPKPLISHDLSTDVPPPEIPGEDELKQQLFDRLDANMFSYRDAVINENTKMNIFDMAQNIAARYAVREYMKTGHDYKTGEVEFLLQFQDPLALIAESWPSAQDVLIDMDGVIADILEDSDSHGHFARVMDIENPASREGARNTADKEKPSVLERIREAAQMPQEPKKDKPTRKKTEPEL